MHLPGGTDRSRRTGAECVHAGLLRTLYGTAVPKTDASATQRKNPSTLGLDDEAIYELDGYMDFEKYGQDCMENDCVTETEFGLLRRLDPPFPEQRQGQRMM